MNRSVVGVLIVANVAVFGAQYLFDPYVIAHFALWPLGSFYDPDVQISVGFEPWQLLTYAFLHGSVPHIALNLYALYAFGGEVERVLGARRFIWLYFASVLTAGVTQLIVVTATIAMGVAPTLGASGGVFGVLLAFAVLFPHRRVMLLIPPIPMPAWVLVAGYGAIELANGVMGTSEGVAHFAHLGGMLGAAIVLIVVRLRARRYPR